MEPPPWGKRRTELVVIGQDMDHAAITAALERCVMTDEEMAAYSEIFRDALPPWAEIDAEVAGSGLQVGLSGGRGGRRGGWHGGWCGACGQHLEF